MRVLLRSGAFLVDRKESAIVMKSIKWVKHSSKGETTASAARSALALRYDAVRHFLQAAAFRADEGTESVHQLRVSCRRAVAALSVYQEVLPDKARKKMRKAFRSIRRAGDDARDLDVMADQLRREEDSPEVAHLLEKIAAARCEAQVPVLAAHTQWIAVGKLERRYQTLVEGRGSKKNKKANSFARFARRQLKCQTSCFFEAATIDPEDVETMHQLRIRGKSLRYAIELLAPALPEEECKNTYRQLTRLQNRLGKLNDQAAAITRLSRWRSLADSPEELGWLEQGILEAERRLEETRDAFVLWWSEKRQRRLRRSLKTLAKR